MEHKSLSDRSRKRKVDLSIIVITKNEERDIVKCLDQLCKINFLSKEIILVDSNSSDKTRELARKYPIKIINMVKSNVYSAPAGRNIGLDNAKGKFILFIDGDQVLNIPWLRKYIKFLEREDYDAVFGQYVHINAGEDFNGFQKLAKEVRGYRKVGLVGTFLIKDSIDLRKEKFDPFMKGEEEKDLAYRLDSKGKKILCSDEIMAAHFLKKEDYTEVSEKVNFIQGIGQMFRKYSFTKYIFNLVSDFAKYFFLSFLALTSILSLVFLNSIYYKLISPVIFFFVVFYKNKFIMDRHYFIVLLKAFVVPVNVVRGLFCKDGRTLKHTYKLEVLGK